jgi:predicted Kef-type K+ transport protein
MPEQLPLLINFTVALLAAFIGGLIARHLKLPSMVGYMLAGVAIGPFTPGFSGDFATIQQLAELGVIFPCLMSACISHCATCGRYMIPFFLGRSFKPS